MGIVNETARFLWSARQAGVCFGATLTLGRQACYLDDKEFQRLCQLAGRSPPRTKDRWADAFFRDVLETTRLDALDHSSYEGANVVHDMNNPVPAEWWERYDVVFDGGALEHIFDFPTAIANCMKMVKTGGSLILAAPANNQLGHGFYQFSPELFFRVLREEYGYRMVRMIAFEHRFMGAEFGAHGPRYEVADPVEVGSRVSLANAHPLGLLVHARKVAHHAELFASPPQQSDYTRLWSGGPEAPASLAKRLASWLPQGARARLRNHYNAIMVHSLRNRRFFKPIDSDK